MGAKTGQLHGRDHLEDGCDPIPVVAAPVSLVYALYETSSPVTIANSGSAYMPFSLTDGTALLGLTDDEHPTCLTAGTYWVSVAVSVDDLTSGGYFKVLVTGCVTDVDDLQWAIESNLVVTKDVNPDPPNQLATHTLHPMTPNPTREAAA